MFKKFHNLIPNFVIFPTTGKRIVNILKITLTQKFFSTNSVFYFFKISYDLINDNYYIIIRSIKIIYFFFFWYLKDKQTKKNHFKNSKNSSLMKE